MTVMPPVRDSNRVPFNDLVIQWRAIEDGVKRDFEDVFAKSAFCLGSHTEAFERDAADWIGCRHAIGVNSGTSALHLAALALRLGPGDEVLVPAQTFIATVWGVLYAGAIPVLCDVDEKTGAISIEYARHRLTTKTKAILPVHLYGQPANMDDIASFAKSHGLTIIEDAAQSIGARFNGRMTGTIGNIGATSFYPGKNLGAAGEAGLVMTDDDALAEHIRSLRNHGQRERYIHSEVGYNYRMDGLQAVVLRHKLRLLASWIKERQRLASVYASELQGLPLELPEAVNQDHVWHLYVVRTPKRQELREALQSKNIETALHYPIPMHRQPCLDGLKMDRASFPNADRWSNEGLSLPLFIGMTASQQQRVIHEIREFFAHG